jgi:DNA-directed RNA polymerase subunit RPC12/RpoP
MKILNYNCKCGKCKKKFKEHQAKLKDVGGWEQDLVYVCPYCGSDNWDYV